MYCSNCGNKIAENAYVCVNCGILMKNNKKISNIVKNRNTISVTGIISIVIASLAIIYSFFCLVGDISAVGIYTNILEKIFFAMGYNLVQMVLMTIALILSLVSNRKNILNKIGFLLVAISVFLIVTEFVVILIY